MSKRIVRITVDVSKDLLDEFDMYRKKKHYDKRTELIRELMRRFIEDQKADEKKGGGDPYPDPLSKDSEEVGSSE